MMPLELKFNVSIWNLDFFYHLHRVSLTLSFQYCTLQLMFFICFSKASKMMPLELKTKLIKGFEFLLFGNYCICIIRSFLFIVYRNHKQMMFVPINSWSVYFLGNSITTVAFQPDLMTVLTMICIIIPRQKNRKWILCQAGISLNTCPRKSRYFICKNCGMFKGLLQWPTNIRILFGQILNHPF